MDAQQDRSNHQVDRELHWRPRHGLACRVKSSTGSEPQLNVTCNPQEDPEDEVASQRPRGNGENLDRPLQRHIAARLRAVFPRGREGPVGKRTFRPPRGVRGHDLPQGAKGEVDIVTDTVPRLTGHNAMSLPEYLEAHPVSSSISAFPNQDIEGA
jgi:hypothetical protein